jgi:NAD(P)-dependent dehydrogenase (short-subunit alcohol dehydrogenase family)
MDLESLPLDHPFDFRGKVAVVSGGSGVLCRPIALALGRQGATVIVLGHTNMAEAEAVAEQINSKGGRADAFQVDVIDKAALEQLAETIHEKWGLVDILINGAGGAKKEATTSQDLSFFDLPEDALRWVFDLNMMGTLFPCQIFGRDMAQKKAGAILNIISMSAYRPITRSIAYSAAKAAAMNFTQWLAVHMAQEYTPRIRVNGIAPGIFLARQNRFLLSDEKTGQLTERGHRLIDHTPMGRFGEPEELVGPALLLLSDLAGYVTGITLNVDGGQGAYSGV